jgi:hypothetical protein
MCRACRSSMTQRACRSSNCSKYFGKFTILRHSTGSGPTSALNNRSIIFYSDEHERKAAEEWKRRLDESGKLVPANVTRSKIAGHHKQAMIAVVSHLQSEQAGFHDMQLGSFLPNSQD